MELKQVTSCNAEMNTRDNDSKKFNLLAENMVQSMKYAG
jgi:hypothetical protein